MFLEISMNLRDATLENERQRRVFKYVGSAPGLIYGGTHSADEKAVFEQLCQIVEEAIHPYRKDAKPLPPAKSSRVSQLRLNSSWLTPNTPRASYVTETTDAPGSLFHTSPPEDTT
jgi:hypothetical protein